MRNRRKRIVALGMALCMSMLCLPPGGSGKVLAETGMFDMLASSPVGEEDWSKLRIDMGSPETNASGYGGTPLANGVFAAKENGGVQEDIFPLNHSTFWSGDPAYRDSMFTGNGGYGNSQEARNTAYNELVETLKNAYTEGIRQEERDALMKSVAETTQGMWESNTQSSFISVGQMKLSFPELEDTVDYQRILDLDTAVSEIRFTKDETAYIRETFISNPDNVMVTRITNENDLPMDMDAELVLPSRMIGKSDENKVTVDEEKNEIVMTERAPYNFEANKWDENRGTLLEARAKVILPEGGEVSYGESSITVMDAPEILVLYTCETSFKDAFTDPSNSGVDYSGKVRATLDNAEEKTYEELKERHLEEYRSLFRRFWLDMDGEDIVTSNGISISPYEYARHYQYGRYINIACERENSTMSQGLLGMWSPAWVGPNQGAYFMNENMQKMQVIKGAGNLADSSDGQYNVIKSWASDETGGRTAEVTYGAEDGSWMMSHST